MQVGVVADDDVLDLVQVLLSVYSLKTQLLPQTTSLQQLRSANQERSCLCRCCRWWWSWRHQLGWSSRDSPRLRRVCA